MANDISYFKVQGDDTQYSFNDADLESRIGAEEMGTEAQTITGAIAELAGAVGENTADIETNEAAIGTLSNLTTSAKGSLVAAINEVDSHADTNAANIATNASAISQLNSKLSKTSGTYTPTFSWSNGTGLTVSHVAFDYHYLAGVLFVQGRMNITSLGTPGNSNLLVTLPSGYSFAAGVGGFGMVVQDSGVLPLVVRAQGTNLCIVNGPGGNYASTVINSTGFIGIQATLPVG